MKAVLRLFLVFIVLFCLWMGAQWQNFTGQEIKLEQPQLLEVAQGDSLHRINKKLLDRQWIKCKLCAQLYARWRSDLVVVPGEYQLREQMTYSDLIELLEQRDIVQYKITLVEGWTLKNMLEALWAEPKLERTLDSADPKALLNTLEFIDAKPERLSAEGLFFPATYFYTRGMRDIDVLKMAYAKMREVLTAQWAQRADELPYTSPYEALIMASIIEKETSHNGERDKIAGVFVRRLKLGMMLQTDPTVIYGMGERYTGNITRRDLQTPTPYNTYVINGLPPTPIALAGRESIRAALHPDASKSLYFVADGKGGHVFSNNLRAHNRAVRQYLKYMREQK